MLVLDAEAVRSRAPLPAMIACLREAFSRRPGEHPRQIVDLSGGAGERLLLVMPAFDSNGAGAVKLATVSPGNAASGLPTVQAAIVAFSETGTPIAFIDGASVTQLRTAAASALASQYLSRADSAHLVVIGTGALAPYMAAAHCTVRPIARVSVCGRRRESAVATINTIRSLVPSHVELTVAQSVEDAVASADIVTCATSSKRPVLLGRWLKRGVFVDLVGSFSRAAREADDDVVLRSRIFVDTFAGALAEAGDLLDPLERGILRRERIEGELADLVCGRVQGRGDKEESIVFKSVGTAIEDLAAVRLIVGKTAL
jgi:ornithine cyclodeaminase/alanine dehydrogenase-like protein (mu-crystallin family)